MEDKSIARLELELDQLKDEKKELESELRPISGLEILALVLLLIGIFIHWGGIVGFVFCALYYIQVKNTNETKKRIIKETTKKIRLVKEQIVIAKEKQS